MNKIHSWHTNGGSTTVELTAGNYTIVSHLSPNPRVGASDPPVSLPDPTLTVTVGGLETQQGPGDFSAPDGGTTVIKFGLPRVVELWKR